MGIDPTSQSTLIRFEPFKMFAHHMMLHIGPFMFAKAADVVIKHEV
jgi:hypothetical protein